MDLGEIVDRLIHAKDAGDWETWRSSFTSDATFTLRPGPAMTVDELLAVLVTQREEGHRFWYGNARRIVSADALVEEHDVTFAAPDTEDRVVEACLIFRFEEGRISRIDEYMAQPLG